MAKGKYFDITSLSGGEQTLVALSLLFAIQKYKPYHFYIFDEIDAALDKRNSERLAGLLNQYMKTGQYIVVTHNDAVILNSQILYGVSMHEGVSRVLSLKIGDEVIKKEFSSVQEENQESNKKMDGKKLTQDLAFLFKGSDEGVGLDGNLDFDEKDGNEF